MPARYHPFYDGLWSHYSLEGLPFQAKAFFVWTWTNQRLRPSGIYRVSDEQITADTRLPLPQVRGYLQELVARHRIVRDGDWLFVRGYFKRQPKHDNLLKAVELDVRGCASVAILDAWGEQYPAHRQWSTDRRVTVEQRSGNGRATVERNPSSEQSSSEQSRAEHNVPLSNRQATVGQRSATRSAAVDILQFLNRKTDHHYPTNSVNLGFVMARIDDGATPDQCRAVIACKARQWRGDPKMHPYLRPKTLFGKTNFSQYLGELPAEAFLPDEDPADA